MRLSTISFEKLFIVYGQKKLDEYIIPQNNIIWVHQDPQNGTGHAVQVAVDEIKKHYKETSNLEVLVCNGDAPFIRKTTIMKMKLLFHYLTRFIQNCKI